MGRPRNNPFNPREFVRAKQSCSIQVGADEYTFTSKSQPVKGNHPAVLSNPDLFEAVDSDYQPPSAAA